MIREAVIPRHNLPWLETQVEKLNKKARKLNVPEVILEEIGPEGERDVRTPFGPTYRIPLVRVRIGGEIPHIDGWRLIARLNRTPAGNVVNSVPGAPTPPERARTFYGCDQCGHNRYRKDVFVLEKDGEHKIVGRTCLKDFFAGRTPDALIRYATLIDRFVAESEKAERDEPLVHHNDDAYSLDLILTYTIAEIEVYGWHPASAGIQATKRGVQNYILESRWGENRLAELTALAKQKGIDPFSPSARIKIDAAVNWAQNLEPKNDYEWNLRTIARVGFVSFNQIGYAVSLIPTFLRVRERNSQPKTARPVSNYVGNVGDREQIEGSVVFVNSYNTAFGDRTLVKVVTDDGDLVNWWTSGSFNYGNTDTPIVRQDRIRLIGKVKSHEDYKGQKQTTINYGKAELL